MSTFHIAARWLPGAAVPSAPPLCTPLELFHPAATGWCCMQVSTACISREVSIGVSLLLGGAPARPGAGEVYPWTLPLLTFCGHEELSALFARPENKGRGFWVGGEQTRLKQRGLQRLKKARTVEAQTARAVERGSNSEDYRGSNIENR